MPPKAKGRSASVGKAKAKAKSAADSKGKAAAASVASPPPAAEEAAAGLVSEGSAAPEAAQREEKAELAAEHSAAVEVPETQVRDDRSPSAEELPSAGAAPSAPSAKEAPAARGQKLQDEVPDPWAAFSEDAQHAKVMEESWDILQDFEEDPGSSACHAVAKDSGHESLATEQRLQKVLVSLDFSENALARIDALPALWLRNLSLGNNPLTSLDGIGQLFPRLLCVDLSFVELPSLEGGAWEALAACPRLRSITAEGAGVATFEDMPQFSTLRSLELLENDIEDIGELETLADRCPALLKLDLRDNPVATEPFYGKTVEKLLPHLLEHNNQSMKKYTSKIAGRSAGAISVDPEVNAVDGLYKNEGCSCLEGNPCLDPATCVDWEHREAVAAEARRRKGLRGPAGEMI